MSRAYGVLSATVTSNEDPEGLGRVRVRFTWLEGDTETQWARIATLMAGDTRGSYIMPMPGDEVLIAFEHGMVDSPYVIGYLFSQTNPPPATDPHHRVIRSVNGHEIELYDPEVSSGDKGYIRLKYADGNVVELSNAMIRIECTGAIVINGQHVLINGRYVVPTAGSI